MVNFKGKKGRVVSTLPSPSTGYYVLLIMAMLDLLRLQLVSK